MIRWRHPIVQWCGRRCGRSPRRLWRTEVNDRRGLRPAPNVLRILSARVRRGGELCRKLSSTAPACQRSIHFKDGAHNLGLTDDGKQRADSNLAVVGYGHRDGGVADVLLHDDVTAPLTNYNETVLGQQRADLLARQDTQPTQPQPPVASRKSAGAGGVSIPRVRRLPAAVRWLRSDSGEPLRWFYPGWPRRVRGTAPRTIYLLVE